MSHAANFFFAPASATKEAEQVFTVDVYLSSEDQSANAVSGVILFPKQVLQVKSLSQSGSIMSLWVQPPSFSNTEGTIQFEGISFNPGFIGRSGKLFSITFIGKADGLATVSFSSASVLANDGLGTQIISGSSAAAFRISTPTSDSSVPSGETTNTPNVVSENSLQSGENIIPILSSPTHPDQSQWYRERDLIVRWHVPKEVSAVRLLFNDIPNSTPSVVHSADVAETSISNIVDGVWYLHAQFRTAKGWGPVEHFRVQIDSTPPEPFMVSFPHAIEDSTDPRPIALFNTPDLLSGISHYEIKIGNGDFYKVELRDIESNPYSLPTQTPGKSTVIVRAFDLAGNVMTAAEEVIITALPAPHISAYPEKIETGDILLLSGETLPSVNLVVSLTNEGGKVVTSEERSNSLGNFRVIWPKRLDAGTYRVNIVTVDDRGAISAPSQEVTIIVVTPPFLTFGSRAISFVSFILFVIACAFGIILLLLKSWYGMLRFKKHLYKKVTRIDDNFSNSFDHVQKMVAESIFLLEKTYDKRMLTIEEKKVLSNLKQELQKTEKTMKEEIHNIEDTLQ